MVKYILRSVWLFTSLSFLLACEENMIQRNAQTVYGKKSNGGGGRPGDLKANPGESYPFPEIIEKEFIPSYEPFDDFKCLTWKITWPLYDSDYDMDLIPTVLSLNNGELNSINFLNSTDPQNTHNSTMSLYLGSKVESANVMWSELDYSFDADQMMTVYFEKGDVPLSTIEDWVTERPKQFQSHWPLDWPASNYNDLSYEEGDFIHFIISGPDDLYGGIRIVSMSPRIIEVYLAVPNN